jgi:hypothetical protein
MGPHMGSDSWFSTPTDSQHDSRKAFNFKPENPSVIFAFWQLNSLIWLIIQYATEWKQLNFNWKTDRILREERCGSWWPLRLGWVTGQVPGENFWILQKSYWLWI